jgi:hypothetical protein
MFILIHCLAQVISLKADENDLIAGINVDKEDVNDSMASLKKQ